MDLALVMDELAAALDTIDGLRCFGYPVDTVTPPAGFVDYPDAVKFDLAYQRGLDEITLPVVVVVGKTTDKRTRDLIAAYCKGDGDSSVKQALEAYAYTACGTVAVIDLDFFVWNISGTNYLGANFNVEVSGSGITEE